MTYQEVLANARTCMGPYCKSCPTCNGVACKNTIPGPGAKGIGTGFIRNYQKWQELCVNMDTICDNVEVDTSCEIFGKKVVIPVFAAPVGAMQLHYGDKYDDLTYNDLLVSGCAKAGIAAFTGDGVNASIMEGATKAIAKNNGCGVPTVKPWNMELIEKKMALTGIVHMGAYLRKMAIDGYVVNLEIQEFKEIIRLLGIANNNINQIAHKFNATGRIYDADLEEVRTRIDGLYDEARKILIQLSKIK